MQDILNQEYAVEWSDANKMESIITGISGDNPKVVAFIDAYYLNISDTDENTVLSEFFTEDELNNLIFTHPYRMSGSMKKLLVIFISEDSISNNIKTDVIGMIKNGLTIDEALRAYLMCIPDLSQLTYENDFLFEIEEISDSTEIEAITTNETLPEEEKNLELPNEIIIGEIEILTQELSNAEGAADVLNYEHTVDISTKEETLENNKLYQLAEVNGFLQATALSGDTMTKEEIWKNSMLENKHYQGYSEPMNIEGKMGSTSIRRNDISIPLKDGVNLECPIQYNSNDAYAISFGNEYTNPSLWNNSISYRINNPVSPLGVGWSLGNN